MKHAKDNGTCDIISGTNDETGTTCDGDGDISDRSGTASDMNSEKGGVAWFYTNGVLSELADTCYMIDGAHGSNRAGSAYYITSGTNDGLSKNMSALDEYLMSLAVYMVALEGHIIGLAVHTIKLAYHPMTGVASD